MKEINATQQEVIDKVRARARARLSQPNPGLPDERDALIVGLVSSIEKLERQRDKLVRGGERLFQTLPEVATLAAELRIAISEAKS